MQRLNSTAQRSDVVQSNHVRRSVACSCDIQSSVAVGRVQIE